MSRKARDGFSILHGGDAVLVIDSIYFELAEPYCGPALTDMGELEMAGFAQRALEIGTEISRRSLVETELIIAAAQAINARIAERMRI